MELIEYVKMVIEKNGERIAASDVFLQLTKGNYKSNPEAALQLAIALVCDKPIIIGVIDGAEIPRHIKKIADKIVHIKGPDDMDKVIAATKEFCED